MNLYLIPGMGTDHRIFDDYRFDSTLAHPIQVQWVKPVGATTLGEYAQLLSNQIDTTAPFVILGVSMGGMLAMELSRTVKPKAVILVSSARSSSDLPRKARVGRHFSVYCLLTDRVLTKIAAKKWFFKEIKSERHIALYQSMLTDTGADFLKWQIGAIARWSFVPDGSTPPVFQIHGDKDKILPLKKGVVVDVVVPDGTHKMVVNQIDLLAGLIEKYVTTLRNGEAGK